MNKNGFSLVEVLMAMVLFTTGGLSAVNMINSAYAHLGVARTYTEMSSIGTGYMEQFMAVPFEQLKDRDGDGATGLEDVGEDADGFERKERYEVSWNIAHNTPIQKATTICVIIEPAQPSNNGMNRTVNLVSLRTSP